MPYARILVATDFSDSSMRAAALARKLGGAQTRYRVLHIRAPPPQVDMLQPTELAALHQFESEARTNLGLELEGWARRAGLPSATTIVRNGQPAREIDEEARAFDADLVVMGARGMTRLERILVGSVARGAVRRVTSADMLVARSAQDAPDVRRMLLAVDFHAPSRDAAARSLDLAKATGAQLHLMHVLEPGPLAEAAAALEPAAKGHAARRDAARKELSAWNQRDLESRAIEVLVEGKAVNEVVGFAEQHGVDLVVTGSVGHSALERAVLGSVAEAIVERAPCSVLVVRRAPSS